MTWTRADIPDLTGRTAVVTGGNGGLGLQSVTALAAAGAHVVVAARARAKAAAAVETVLERHPAASLEIVPVDLGDLASVRAAADQVLGAHRAVDLLVNNAGVMAPPQGRTADGFETTLGVDHLGHFALTAHLLPALLRADAARVVTVTSIARFMGAPLDPGNPHLVGAYDPWKAYAQAKMANYHFGIGLQRRFAAAGARAASLLAHPGLSNTDLQATTASAGGAGRLADLFVPLTRWVGMPAEVGVRPQLRAATDPAARGGGLWAPRFGATGAAVRRPVLRRWDLDRRTAELWEVSERETGVVLDVDAAARAAGEG